MKVTKYSKRYTMLLHLDNGDTGSYQEVISRYGYTPWFKSGWRFMINNSSVVK